MLHDFDVSGFSIYGTLGTDSRRYTFQNLPSLIDIGLRLKDVEDLNLQSEPVTLRRNGGTRTTRRRRPVWRPV